MKNQKMSHFVVTGGNGFIGSHLCRLLSELGHQISIIDDYSTSPKKFTHNFGTFYIGDISDASIWRKIALQNKVDAVFHFAAKALVGESESNPFMYYESNVVKTLQMLDHMNRQGIDRVIFSSSCTTFGHPKQSQIDETHPQQPVSTYGKSKFIIEQVLRDLAEKNKMKSVVLRYFNAAGCSPDGVIGENHDPETHLIPNIILSYLSNFKKPLQIFGKDFTTRDGTCVRDYIHVVDLAQAHFSAFQYMQECQEYFSDFNLGTEKGTSNLEMIKFFQEVVKIEVPFEFAKARAGDPANLISSSVKAKKHLNFNPKYSVKDCLEHSLNYFKNKRREYIN